MGNPEEDAEIDELKAEYIKTVPEKLQEVERLIAGFLSSPSGETRDALKRPIHKIAGSAGSYGFAAVTDMCRAMEQDLASIADFSSMDSWKEKLETFFSKLKEELGKKPSS